MERSNFQLVLKNLGIGRLTGPQARHWLTPSKLDALLVELRKEFEGLRRDEIAELLRGDGLSFTAGSFVREEFQAGALLEFLKAIELPALLSIDDRAKAIAEVLNPLTSQDEQVLALEDLSAELQIKKVILAAGTLRKTLLVCEQADVPELISAIEDYQRHHFYMHVESGGETLFVPRDKYYARFQDMLQYGLGITHEEAEELERQLLKGFSVEREVSQLHFKLSRLEGYYADDAFSTDSQERFSSILSETFMVMNASQRKKVIEHLHKTVYSVVRDLRREALQLPPSPQKKALLSLLNGREPNVWERLDPEKLKALSDTRVS